MKKARAVGTAWTPGANDATTLTATTDIQINGQKLAKGPYTVWSVPEKDTWTVVVLLQIEVQ